MKSMPIIITNHNPEEIKIKSEFDDKKEVVRIDVRLKKSKSKKGWGRSYGY
ncbi:MAG: hypothetical protein ACTSRZ_18005 [Promethearchaeota archaeon]